jgi:F-type H+-transporting ATPase subunit epsilon
MEVQPGGVTVQANTAERAEEIDLERAEAARRRAEARLSDRAQANVDFARAEAALRRALTRLDVAKLRRRKGGRRAEVRSVEAKTP